MNEKRRKEKRLMDMLTGKIIDNMIDMNNVALCRVCLASDTRMYDLKGTRYQGIFEKLATKLITPDRRPKTMCYICVSLLQRCRRFLDMSRKAEYIMTQLLQNGIQVTQENVAELNLSMKESLSVTPTQYLFTGNIQKSTHEFVQKDSISMKEEEISDEELLVETVHTDDSFHEAVKEHATFIKDVETPDEELLVETAHTNVCAVSSKEGYLIVTPTVHNQDNSHVTDTNEAISVESNVSENVWSSEISNNKSVCLELKEDSDHDVFNNFPFTMDVKQPKFKMTYCCDYCNRIFIVKSKLALHIKKYHTSAITQMPCSGKKQFNRKAYTYSLQNQEKKPYACALCDKVFVNRGKLRIHERVHTGEKPFACDICGKCFNQNSNLSTHMRTHTREKPYSCDICDKAFNQKSNLTTHKKLHIQENIVTSENNVISDKIVSGNVVSSEICNACDICGKCFKQNSNLSTHMRTHSREKPYSCDICGKAFNQKSNLTTHKKIHIKEIKCFNENSNLSTHIRTHTREKPYSCDICGKAFNQKSNLTTHKKLHIQVKILSTENGVISEKIVSGNVVSSEICNILRVCSKVEDDSDHYMFNTLQSTIDVDQPTFKTAYSCNICNMTFDLKSKLAIHIKYYHTRQMPFSDEKQLNRKAYSESNLRVHPGEFIKEVKTADGELLVKTVPNADSSHAVVKEDAIFGKKVETAEQELLVEDVHTDDSSHAVVKENAIFRKKVETADQELLVEAVHTEDSSHAVVKDDAMFMMKVETADQELLVEAVHTDDSSYAVVKEDAIFGKKVETADQELLVEAVHTDDSYQAVVKEDDIFMMKVETADQELLVEAVNTEDSYHAVVKEDAMFMMKVETADQELLVEAVHTDDSSHAVEKKDAIFVKKVETVDQELLVEAEHTDDSSHAVVKEDVMFIKEVETEDEELLVEAVHTEDSSHAVVKEDAMFIMKVETADEEFLVETAHTDVCTVSSKAGYLIVTPTVHTQDSSHVTDTKEAISVKSNLSENFLSSEISNNRSVCLELEDDSDHDVFNNHMSAMDVEQPTFKTTYTCSICSRTFHVKSILSLHLKQCHTSRMQFSGEKQLNRNAIGRHMRVHSRKKPYACALCDKVYAHRSNLTIHQRAHTGEKPFACDICGKKYSLSTYLKIHMRVHTREKPYSCDICGKDFAQKQNLKSHERIHTREEPYACEVCGDTFRYKLKLKRHHIKFHQKNNIQSEADLLRVFGSPVV